MNETTDTGPRVLFIGGYGRSGSTVLDRVLGSAPGVFSAGEIRHIWREGYLENRLCGCGEQFRSCPFWAKVSDRAFGGTDSLDLERVLAVKSAVDRPRRIPQIASGRSSARRRDQLAWYGRKLRALLEAIAEVSGARLIVDSSKDVSHGHVLASLDPPIDLRVVHLTRDSRAVAYSWRRRRKFNPGSGEPMQRYGLLRASAEWVAINGLTATHRPAGTPYMPVRYERLAAAPLPVVREILDFAGEPPASAPVSASGSVELQPSHTVAGNPNRFQSGTMRISPDREWRRQMPRSERALVTALTLPVLAGSGYLRRTP
jgi:hypothetical protein